MSLKKKISSLIAEGNVTSGIETILEHISLGDPWHNELIVLLGEYNNWEKEKRLGLKPKRKILREINFSILNIVDRIEKEEKSSSSNSED